MTIDHTMSDWFRQRQNRWPAILCITGAFVTLAGLQTWLFGSQLQQRVDLSNAQLALLQQETVSNRTIDQALSNLQDFWRLSTDDAGRRELLLLRDAVIAGFHQDPVATTAKFLKGVNALHAQSEAQQEILGKLQRDLTALHLMYADHAGAAVDFFESPGWTMQPAALFLTNSPGTAAALQFNHAVYLTYVRDIARAEELLNELRSSNDEPALNAQIVFALSRLQFEKYQVEKDPALLSEALRLARHAVRSDASQKLTKLYLAYLLTIDPQVASSDSPADQGDGSGEADGERGAIDVDAGDF